MFYNESVSPILQPVVGIALLLERITLRIWERQLFRYVKCSLRLPSSPAQAPLVFGATVNIGSCLWDLSGLVKEIIKVKINFSIIRLITEHKE